jgi:hypothetical protein
VKVAQYRYGNLVIDVEQYSIANERCWEFYSRGGVCMSEKIMYATHLSGSERVPSKDEVRLWLGL